METAHIVKILWLLAVPALGTPASPKSASSSATTARKAQPILIQHVARPPVPAATLAEHGRSILYNGAVYYWHDNGFYFPDGRPCPQGFPPVAPPPAVMPPAVMEAPQVDGLGNPPLGHPNLQLEQAVAMELPADVQVSVAGEESGQFVEGGDAGYPTGYYPAAWPQYSQYYGTNNYHPSYYGAGYRYPSVGHQWYPQSRWFPTTYQNYYPSAMGIYGSYGYPRYGYRYGYGRYGHNHNALGYAGSGFYPQRNPFWRFPWVKGDKKQDKKDKKDKKD